MSKLVSAVKKLNLALQGGGSHGAFTWGVLDYLLEDGRIDPEGISATSAGSMNAAIMVQGLMNGGNKGARHLLEKFWHRVSDSGAVFCPVSCAQNDFFTSFNPFFPSWAKDAEAGLNFLSMMSRTVSPYQFNPLGLNPLRDILRDLINFKQLRENCEAKLFITATNVKTGDAKIFRTEDLTLEVLLASAALPNIFQAVEIKGEHYWDGGFMGNPSLWPLFYEAEAHDLLIVHVNPLVREDVPTDAYAIENRVNEITFNASMLKELRAISFVQKLIHRDMLKDEHKAKYRDILLHAIRAEDAMSHLGASSKMDTSWPFLTTLRDQGRMMAKDWLDAHYDQIGVVSSIDIQRDYLAAHS